MPIQVTGNVIDKLDFAFASITAEVSITATSSATGNTCITTGAFGIDHTDDYYVEVSTPYLTLGTTNLDVELWDGSTFLQTLTGHMVAGATLGQRPYLSAKVTLAQGSHTLTVKAFVDGGTGKFGAGTGATGQPPPAFIRVRSA